MRSSQASDCRQTHKLPQSQARLHIDPGIVPPPSRKSPDQRCDVDTSLQTPPGPPLLPAPTCFHRKTPSRSRTTSPLHKHRSSTTKCYNRTDTAKGVVPSWPWWYRPPRPQPAFTARCLPLQRPQSNGGHRKKGHIASQLMQEPEPVSSRPKHQKGRAWPPGESVTNVVLAHHLHLRLKVPMAACPVSRAGRGTTRKDAGIYASSAHPLDIDLGCGSAACRPTLYVLHASLPSTLPGSGRSKRRPPGSRKQEPNALTPAPPSPSIAGSRACRRDVPDPVSQEGSISTCE